MSPTYHADASEPSKASPSSISMPISGESSSSTLTTSSPGTLAEPSGTLAEPSAGSTSEKAASVTPSALTIPAKISDAKRPLFDYLASDWKKDHEKKPPIKPEHVVIERNSFSNNPALSSAWDGDAVAKATPSVKSKSSHPSNNASETTKRSYIHGAEIVVRRVSPDDPADQTLLLYQAIDALKLGHEASALWRLDKLYHRSPKNDQVAFLLGSIYHHQAQWDEAKKLYEVALESNPNNYDALNNYSTLLIERSPEDAIEALRRLQLLRPSLALIPAQLGVASFHLKHFHDAAFYFQQAVERDRNHTGYLYNLAVTLDTMNMQEPASHAYKDLMAAHERGHALPVAAHIIQNRLEALTQHRTNHEGTS